MKRNVCRIGSAAVCAALCLTLGCSCSVLPPASGKPAAPASSVPTDAHGDPLYDSSRLDDGKLRILYGYDNSGGACTVLCGSKVLYQSFRSENVNLLQDTVTGETNYWFRTWADPDAYCGRRSGLFDKDGNEVMTFEGEQNASMQNGLLMGGFGSMAELSANAMGTDFAASFYQEDGKVVYGATQDGTRKYLSWLHKLYDQGLINFENMQNRDVNPFGDLNAGEASRGETGYIFSNQSFGGNYSTMAAQNGDENCNWWPVQDVAETSGQTIPFYEETSMVDTTGAAKISISSQCENVETALQFLDYGYSYEGGLLYNYGFEQGSGHDVETWYYDDSGEPMFDGDALLSVAESTNLASGVVATKDLAGVVYDTRLSFEFGERELSCFDAWSTNKNGSNNLGSDVVLTSEESTEASAIYSDIITHVATSALQFINGAQDVDDDAVWNSYVKSIEDMNIDGLTEIIQTAYDRVN